MTITFTPETLVSGLSKSLGIPATDPVIETKYYVAWTSRAGRRFIREFETPQDRDEVHASMARNRYGISGAINRGTVSRKVPQSL